MASHGHLFVPAFNEIRYYIVRIARYCSHRSPLCRPQEDEEIILADGSYIGPLSLFLEDDDMEKPGKGHHDASEPLGYQARERIRKRGFLRLSPGQEQAIPLILKKKNIVLIAPTGDRKNRECDVPVL